MAFAESAALARLYAATATCWSVEEVSQPGLMSGGSFVSAEEMEMEPRESGATSAV